MNSRESIAFCVLYTVTVAVTVAVAVLVSDSGSVSVTDTDTDTVYCVLYTVYRTAVYSTIDTCRSGYCMI